MMFREDRFRQLRLKKGYTHEEIAEQLGIATRMIARYESSESEPSSETVAKMARVLVVSADYLLDLTDDPSPHIVVVDNLTQKEKEVLAAMRRGEPMVAIRVLSAPNGE